MLGFRQDLAVERQTKTATVVLVTMPGTSHGTPIKMLPVAPTAKQTPATPRARSKRGEIVMVTFRFVKTMSSFTSVLPGDPRVFLRMRSLTVKFCCFVVSRSRPVTLSKCRRRSR